MNHNSVPSSLNTIPCIAPSWLKETEVIPETLSIAHAVDKVPTKIASGSPVLSPTRNLVPSALNVSACPSSATVEIEVVTPEIPLPTLAIPAAARGVWYPNPVVIATLEILPALGVPVRNLKTFAEDPSTVKSCLGRWNTLLIKTKGLLLISVPLFTSLYAAVVVLPWTLRVNSVAAIPVNAREISSNTTFWSSVLSGSNLLLNALPLKVDPVSRPTGPILP